MEPISVDVLSDVVRDGFDVVGGVAHGNAHCAVLQHGDVDSGIPHGDRVAPAGTQMIQ